MGVLLLDPCDNAILYMKGSDDAIFRRAKNSTEYELECQEQVESFSKLGLRTLVAAYREVRTRKKKKLSSHVHVIKQKKKAKTQKN